jgi:hypothetical protein
MDAELEVVLEAYADAEPGPSRATLVVWINRYPRFARELTDFTAQWQLLKWAGDEDEAATSASASEVLDEEQERMVLRGVSAAQSVFFAKRAARLALDNTASSTDASAVSGTAPQAVAPIQSLIAAARRVGLEYAALKERVGLSDALIQKLNRRLINPRSVPARVIEDIAAALQQHVEAVRRYLALEPTFALGAQHRASQAPMLPKAPEDFFEAVRNDGTLSADRKTEILALPRPDVTGASHER